MKHVWETDTNLPLYALVVNLLQPTHPRPTRTPSTTFHTRPSQATILKQKGPLLAISHAGDDAVLRRALSSTLSRSSEHASLCVCRYGHQGGEQDHRAGELSTLVYEQLCLGSVPSGRRTEGTCQTYAHVSCSLQTVQLRTHSIHPPYIDEDLQNRYVRTW